MYHRQQNKCYPPPKGVYLPISKLHSILAVANLLAHNNTSQICYCGQISLQSAAVNCSFSDNVWGNIYFAVFAYQLYDGTVGTYIKMSLSQQYNLQILVFLIRNYVPMLEFLRADSYSLISLWVPA